MAPVWCAVTFQGERPSSFFYITFSSSTPHIVGEKIQGKWNKKSTLRYRSFVVESSRREFSLDLKVGQIHPLRRWGYKLKLSPKIFPPVTPLLNLAKKVAASWVPIVEWVVNFCGSLSFWCNPSKLTRVYGLAACYIPFVRPPHVADPVNWHFFKSTCCSLRVLSYCKL